SGRNVASNALKWKRNSNRCKAVSAPVKRGRGAPGRMRCHMLSPEDGAATPVQVEELFHITDDAAGITRRRAGTGFSYREASGTTLKDRASLQRIRSLAIPPAWSEVWICPDPNGHLQATGRDEKG